MNSRMKALRDELADKAHHVTSSLDVHAYHNQDRFKEGFDAASAEYEKIIAGLVESLLKLRNETAGFLSMASPYNHGHTNIQCLQNRINLADEALNELAKFRGGQK